MSYLSFKPGPSRKGSENLKQSKPQGSVKKAFSQWILENYGKDYRKEINRQRSLKKKGYKPEDKDQATVGIIGGGFAGLYSGLILQSLGIESEVFEASDRVGGRIDTWYSTEYDPKNVDMAGLYGEVGGMRVPQFSADMLPVQHLTLAVNAVLKRNGLEDKMVQWRKFYYNSEVQRLRYNNIVGY